jgi:V/A-type H+-transporting ATPase subunit D
MARAALNKSALHKQREELRLYERLLPSLDLKRMQLTGELRRSRDILAREQTEVEREGDRIAGQLPMLANREIDLSGLVRVESVQMEEENVVGVKLPVLMGVTFSVHEYSMLAKPHWVDVLVDQLQRMVELRARVQVAQERMRRLERAVRRITQRVNLFEKVLIPAAKENIKYIQIFLADAERAAVIRSKITKAMHERQRKTSATRGAMP